MGLKGIIEVCGLEGDGSSELRCLGRIEISRRPDFRCSWREQCTMIQAWVYALAQ